MMDRKNNEKVLDIIVFASTAICRTIDPAAVQFNVFLVFSPGQDATMYAFKIIHMVVCYCKTFCKKVSFLY